MENEYSTDSWELKRTGIFDSSKYNSHFAKLYLPQNLFSLNFEEREEFIQKYQELTVFYYGRMYFDFDGMYPNVGGADITDALLNINLEIHNYRKDSLLILDFNVSYLDEASRGKVCLVGIVSKGNVFHYYILLEWLSGYSFLQVFPDLKSTLITSEYVFDKKSFIFFIRKSHGLSDLSPWNPEYDLRKESSKNALDFVKMLSILPRRFDKNAVTNMRQNLSKLYKDWSHFEDFHIERIETDLLLFLEGSIEYILHPPKIASTGIRDAFLQDAKYMCDYGLTLNFNELYNAKFNKFLAEVYLTENDLKNALSKINHCKAFYFKDSVFFKDDLEEVYELEWNVYERLGHENKSMRILMDITKLNQPK